MMPAPGEFLSPNSWAANAPGDAAWFGLQTLAPNLASLLTGQSRPALPNLPETPGKVPSTNDPRIAGAVGEMANLGLNFLPLPAIGLAAGAGRWIPGLMRRAAPELLASKSARLYNPPAKSPRPFEADYPSGAAADATGRLTADIEGRPLVAERIVGRRTLGGTDEAFTPAEIDAVATAVTGHIPETVAARQIRRSAGVFRIDYDAAGTPVYKILVDRALSPAQKDRVVAHEVGHVIDHFAAPRRGIPQQGIKAELNRNYNTGVTGQERERHLTLPKHEGYRPDKAAGELMAEAIRAYLTDPNYVKTVAPETAKAIRAAVNAHPTLSKIIQFNTIAGLAATNGIDPDALPIPRQQPPVFPQ
jgi:hypothetical protein